MLNRNMTMFTLLFLGFVLCSSVAMAAESNMELIDANKEISAPIIYDYQFLTQEEIDELQVVGDQAIIWHGQTKDLFYVRWLTDGENRKFVAITNCDGTSIRTMIKSSQGIMNMKIGSMNVVRNIMYPDENFFFWEMDSITSVLNTMCSMAHGENDVLLGQEHDGYNPNTGKYTVLIELPDRSELSEEY